MDNFMFSINATLPIFIVIVIGYLLKRYHVLDDGFVNAANRFNYQVTLPLLLFEDVANANIKDNFDLKYVLFCMIVTTICFWTIYFVAKMFIKDKSIIGAFVQASFRGSAAVLGIAFIMNIYGSVGMSPLMIIGAVPLYNIYAVFVLSMESNDGEPHNLKQTLIRVIKNPILIGIMLGMFFSVFSVDMPVLADKVVHSFAVLASPLALIAIGAGFKGKEAITKLKPTIVATFIKLLLQPMIFLPIAIAMGFTGDKMIAILIMLGAPTTPSCYIMAKNMNNDEILSSSVVVMTTLLSSITLTMWIYFLRCFNCI
ncbi:MAG: AEC family transporter [Erysipelotrichaceae bacterium]